MYTCSVYSRGTHAPSKRPSIHCKCSEQMGQGLLSGHLIRYRLEWLRGSIRHYRELWLPCLWKWIVVSHRALLAWMCGCAPVNLPTASQYLHGQTHFHFLSCSPVYCAIHLLAVPVRHDKCSAPAFAHQKATPLVLWKGSIWPLGRQHLSWRARKSCYSWHRKRASLKCAPRCYYSFSSAGICDTHPWVPSSMLALQTASSFPYL